MPITDVNTNMGDSNLICILEKYKIAGLQIGLRNICAMLILGLRGAIQVDPMLPECVVYQSGAIKAAGRSAAPNIGNTHVLFGSSDDFLCLASISLANVIGTVFQCDSANRCTGGTAVAEKQG